MADFSKKHYEAIAGVLRMQRPRTEAPTYGKWLAMCHGFADTFERDNPRFDRAKFFEACEPMGAP